VVIYLFTLLQGWVYYKTHSLLYVVAIHLAVDLILYLVLIYLYHPDWLSIFIT
jgi:membrane protease YdiL (CAAX protease family)